MTYREFKSINGRMKNSGALSNYCRIKSVDVKNDICVIDMLGNSSAIKTQSTSISGLVNAVLRGSTLKNDLDAKMNILRKKYRTVGKFIDDYI